MNMPFKNTYENLPNHFYENAKPAIFHDPKLIIFNEALAKELGIDITDEKELAAIFSGQKELEGASYLAMAYAAHQFGHFVPKLGDGRAILIGELAGQDVQLKGAGQTPFSRRGDGRSSLGPVLREYLLSEAMHTLGVPTTRALAAVTTGENVYRTGEEPGGIFTRVAPSHIRVGTFQYFAARHDLDSLTTLLNYAIERHYPKLIAIENFSERALCFLEEVTRAQAELVAKWMSFGFIHGVMNTDNFAVGGFTLDYGPCAFMDEYSESRVFSSIDQQGRYSYRNQIPIAQWNILRLADCLWPFISEDQKTAVDSIEKRLNPFMEKFIPKRWEYMAPKFGLGHHGSHEISLMQDFLKIMDENQLDFTLSFYHLPSLLNDRGDFYPLDERLSQWKVQWKTLSPSESLMVETNPLYIPRNHLVQKAIEGAFEGDYSLFHELNTAWKKPFEKNDKYQRFALPTEESERVTRTFCGT